MKEHTQFTKKHNSEILAHSRCLTSGKLEECPPCRKQPDHSPDSPSIEENGKCTFPSKDCGC
eukprot:6474550-Amphidinium_carterae.1